MCQGSFTTVSMQWDAWLALQLGDTNITSQGVDLDCTTCLLWKGKSEEEEEEEEEVVSVGGKSAQLKACPKSHDKTIQQVSQ